LLILNLLLFDC